MRQLKYIEDECFFKEIQALKEFQMSHYCDIYEIANYMDDDYTSMHISEIEDFLDSFELPETNSIVYTDDYIFVFNEPSESGLFSVIVTSIRNGIKKMNDDNNPLKLKELQELNEKLMKQLDEFKKNSQRNSPFKSLEEMHSESCEIQTSNKSSNISINSFNLFKW
jgi:hypothetical protein